MQRKNEEQRDRDQQHETQTAGQQDTEEGKLKTRMQNEGKNFTEYKLNL